MVSVNCCATATKRFSIFLVVPISVWWEKDLPALVGICNCWNTKEKKVKTSVEKKSMNFQPPKKIVLEVFVVFRARAKAGREKNNTNWSILHSINQKYVNKCGLHFTSPWMRRVSSVLIKFEIKCVGSKTENQNQLRIFCGDGTIKMQFMVWIFRHIFLLSKDILTAHAGNFRLDNWLRRLDAKISTKTG